MIPCFENHWCVIILLSTIPLLWKVCFELLGCYRLVSCLLLEYVHLREYGYPTARSTYWISFLAYTWFILLFFYWWDIPIEDLMYFGLFALFSWNLTRGWLLQESQGIKFEIQFPSSTLIFILCLKLHFLRHWSQFRYEKSKIHLHDFGQVSNRQFYKILGRYSRSCTVVSIIGTLYSSCNWPSVFVSFYLWQIWRCESVYYCSPPGPSRNLLIIISFQCRRIYYYYLEGSLASCKYAVWSTQ